MDKTTHQSAINNLTAIKNNINKDVSEEYWISTYHYVIDHFGSKLSVNVEEYKITKEHMASDGGGHGVVYYHSDRVKEQIEKLIVFLMSDAKNRDRLRDDHPQ